jgi:sigma-E factor negative regulatory protein RseC
MVEEQAIIVSTDQNKAALEILRNKPCGLCGQTRGCGLSFWGKLFAHRANTFKAKNHIEAKVGDVVVVGVEESALLFSALTVYGIPLLFLLLGAFSGNAFGDGLHADRNTAIGAVIGLLLGYLWVKGHAQSKSFDTRYSPIILNLVSPASNAVVVRECKSNNSQR